MYIFIMKIGNVYYKTLVDIDSYLIAHWLTKVDYCY